MSLFSGFSTAEDERLAIRMSRRMAEKTHTLMARTLRLHAKSPLPLVGDQHLCRECQKVWPCPTWLTLTDDEATRP